MLTNYDVNRWKLSFSYNIPYQFTYGSEYYTDGSVCITYSSYAITHALGF